jgi:hypothetical protein
MVRAKSHLQNQKQIILLPISTAFELKDNENLSNCILDPKPKTETFVQNFHKKIA